MTGLSSKKTQQRSCVVCRKADNKQDLLRLVCSPEGKVMHDKGLKLKGRGAYVHADLVCIMKAGNSKIWQHVFKRKDVDKESISLAIDGIKKFLMN